MFWGLGVGIVSKRGEVIIIYLFSFFRMYLCFGERYWLKFILGLRYRLF